MPQLTATAIKNLKVDEKDYRIHDGNGLYELVRKTGKKTFVHRQRKPRDTFTTIGNYPTVSLADARAYVANLTSKKRTLKVYKNPHTGEVVETRGGNNKTILHWKAEFGNEEVVSWVIDERA